MFIHLYNNNIYSFHGISIVLKLNCKRIQQNLCFMWTRSSFVQYKPHIFGVWFFFSLFFFNASTNSMRYVPGSRIDTSYKLICWIGFGNLIKNKAYSMELTRVNSSKQHTRTHTYTHTRRHTEAINKTPFGQQQVEWYRWHWADTQRKCSARVVNNRTNISLLRPIITTNWTNDFPTGFSRR